MYMKSLTANTTTNKVVHTTYNTDLTWIAAKDNSEYLFSLYTAAFTNENIQNSAQLRNEYKFWTKSKLVINHFLLPCSVGHSLCTCYAAIAETFW